MRVSLLLRVTAVRLTTVSVETSCTGWICSSSSAVQTVHRCLQCKAPRCMMECCTPFSDVPCRQHLRSSTGAVRRTFSLAGSTVWNTPPGSLLHPTRSFGSFRRYLKTQRIVFVTTFRLSLHDIPSSSTSSSSSSSCFRLTLTLAGCRIQGDQRVGKGVHSSLDMRDESLLVGSTPGTKTQAVNIQRRTLKESKRIFC